MKPEIERLLFSVKRLEDEGKDMKKLRKRVEEQAFEEAEKRIDDAIKRRKIGELFKHNRHP